MSYLSGNSKSTSGSDILGSWKLPSATLGSAEDAHGFDQRKKWERIDRLEEENKNLKEELEQMKKQMDVHKVCKDTIALLKQQLADVRTHRN